MVMQNSTATLEDSLAVFTKLYTSQRYEPAKELKPYVYTEPWTQMFTAALFIIAKTWKQPRYPSVGERINKLVHSNNGIFFSTKRNELSSHRKTWRKLKCTLLNKRSHSEKAKYCMNPATLHSGKGKTKATVKGSVVAREWEREGWTDRVQRIFRAVKIPCMMLK